MKKILFILMLMGSYFIGTAQDSSEVTEQKVREISSTVIAEFTEATSFAYTIGSSFETFSRNLNGSNIVTEEGLNMQRAAYSYLSQGISKSEILRIDDGRAASGALKFLLEKSLKGENTDGSELFGKSPSTYDNSKAADCRWYQFWCLVQPMFTWIVDHSTQIIAIIQAIWP